MGTRAFLDAYIAETARSFLGLSNYYTNFIVYSNAYIKTKQLNSVELSFFFFRGLTRANKEIVLLNIPNRPNSDAIASYDLKKIYTYLRKVYRQREGIRQASIGRAEEDARQAQKLLRGAKRVVEADSLKAVVKEVRQAQQKQDTRLPLSENVDLEVQDLIDAIRSIKISIAEVDKIIEYQLIAPLLRAPVNYAYFISRTTRGGILQERNNRSFISRAPTNINPQRGTITI